MCHHARVRHAAHPKSYSSVPSTGCSAGGGAGTRRSTVTVRTTSFTCTVGARSTGGGGGGCSASATARRSGALKPRNAQVSAPSSAERRCGGGGGDEAYDAALCARRVPLQGAPARGGRHGAGAASARALARSARRSADDIGGGASPGLPI